MKPKPKPSASRDVPQFELVKRLTQAKISESESRRHANITREKSQRLLLAKARDDLVDKDLILKQATYLFVAMRQKMLSASQSYARKFVGLETPTEAREVLTTMVHEMLKELKDMPKKITNPNWMETLSDDDGQDDT